MQLNNDWILCEHANTKPRMWFDPMTAVVSLLPWTSRVCRAGAPWPLCWSLHIPATSSLHLAGRCTPPGTHTHTHVNETQQERTDVRKCKIHKLIYVWLGVTEKHHLVDLIAVLLVQHNTKTLNARGDAKCFRCGEMHGGIWCCTGGRTEWTHHVLSDEAVAFVWRAPGNLHLPVLAMIARQLQVPGWVGHCRTHRHTLVILFKKTTTCYSHLSVWRENETW